MFVGVQKAVETKAKKAKIAKVEGRREKERRKK